MCAKVFAGARGAGVKCICLQLTLKYIKNGSFIDKWIKGYYIYIYIYIAN